MNWEEQLGNLSTVVAGIVGGIISLTFEERLSFGRAVLLLFAGGATAGYVAPFVMGHFGLAPYWSNFTAFILGLFSLRVITLLMELLNIIIANPKLLFQFSKILNEIRNGTTDYRNSNSSGGDPKSNIHVARKTSKKK